MPLLTLQDLEDILNDLGPKFELSAERKSDLCEATNKEFNYYDEFRQIRREATPHKLLQKWQQIAGEVEKVQELLRGFDLDMAFAIDRLRGHPRATRPPTQDEVLEEMSVDPKLAVALEVCRNANSLFPSRQAKEEVDGIKASLTTLAAVAENGISHDSKRKDSKRKHDRHRDLLLISLATLFEETFRMNASTRREGNWPIFLARVLSILEDKEITPDATYDAWLKVKKRLSD